MTSNLFDLGQKKAADAYGCSSMPAVNSRKALKQLTDKKVNRLNPHQLGRSVVKQAGMGSTLAGAGIGAGLGMLAAPRKKKWMGVLGGALAGASLPSLATTSVQAKSSRPPAGPNSTALTHPLQGPPAVRDLPASPYSTPETHPLQGPPAVRNLPASPYSTPETHPLQGPPPAPPTWKEIAAGIPGSIMKQTYTKPLDLDGPVSDVAARVGITADLSRLGSWAARHTGSKTLAGTVGKVGPAVAGQLARLGQWNPASFKGFAALKTVGDTGMGAYDALREGNGNIVKGYDRITDKMQQNKAPMDFENSAQYRHIGPVGIDLAGNGRMDAVTPYVAGHKAIRGLNKADPSLQQDYTNALGEGPRAKATPKAYVDSRDTTDARQQAGQDLTSRATAATPTLKTFEYSKQQGGRTLLRDRQTGISFPTDPQAFDQVLSNSASSAQRQDILKRMYTEMPQLFHSMFDDPRYSSAVQAGLQPSPAAAATQQQLEALWSQAGIK